MSSTMDPRIDQVVTVRMIVTIFAVTLHFSVVSRQAVAKPDFFTATNFNVDATSYDCYSNIICLGEAHRYDGYETADGIATGRLSLISNTSSSGIAYYYQPVKMLDLSSNQTASFSTSFTFDVRVPGVDSAFGDGMAFVMSANNSYIGGPIGGSSGATLGIFDHETYSTPFKSMVVEFDTYYNGFAPINDVSDNHVSFDLVNITASATANASNVGLGNEITKYAWLDYNRDTLLLELRVGYQPSRPITPLLSYTVKLSDFVEEYMWVGFSSASGESFSNFYIGNWTFESSWIPRTPAPAPTPAPTPAPMPTPTPAPTPAPTPGSPTRDRLRGNTLGTIVGMSVGTVGFLIGGGIAIAFIVRAKCSGNFTDDPMMQIDGMPERFTYKQLSVATKGFSDKTKLGQGGFGSVYRGVLPSSGLPVAVKKIKSDSNQGEEGFLAEVSIISRLRHRNLIQLQGWCKDAFKKKYLLVYELMPNGSLDKVLFQPPAESQTTACLSWEQRFNIVTGTAAAVDYLHQGWKQQVIHRDIKSSNIMLDEEWNAKLGDFGLARLVDHKREASTTIVAGTYGYIAPEAAFLGRFTDKTDVYAFGAVVLEIACGRRALSTNFPSDEILLVDWVWQSLSEGALLSTVDKRLVIYDPYWMKVILTVGLLCSHPNPVARPSMRQVVQILAGDARVPPIPTSKPAPFDDHPEAIDYWHSGKESGSSAKFSRSATASMISIDNPDSTRATFEAVGHPLESYSS